MRRLCGSGLGVLLLGSALAACGGQNSTGSPPPDDNENCTANCSTGHGGAGGTSSPSGGGGTTPGGAGGTSSPPAGGYGANDGVARTGTPAPAADSGSPPTPTTDSGNAPPPMHDASSGPVAEGGAVPSPASDGSASPVFDVSVPPTPPSDAGVPGFPEVAQPPEVSFEACPGRAAPSLFASVYADALALTATHVYWRDFGSIMRKPRAGGDAEKVLDVANRGLHLVVRGPRMYWDESAESNIPNVLAAASDGTSGATRIATRAFNWVIGERSVYYTNFLPIDGGFEGQLLSAPLAGGVSTIVSHAVSTDTQLAADSTGVYWYEWLVVDAGGSTIKKLSLPSGSVTTLAPVHFVRLISSDGAHVVWADEGDYLGIATIGVSTLDGAAPLTIATNQQGILQLTEDSSSAYWATSDGLGSLGNSDIVTAPLAGGAAQKLGCNISMVTGLAADESDIYFLSRGSIGTIRQSRP